MTKVRLLGFLCLLPGIAKLIIWTINTDNLVNFVRAVGSVAIVLLAMVGVILLIVGFIPQKYWED